MAVIAGTSRGVFRVAAGKTESVLDCRGVRDLFRCDTPNGGQRVFAATGAGLYASDDQGDTWRLVGMEDREVWQVRGHSNLLYAGTQPAGLFRSVDAGEQWVEVESFAALPEAAAWCVPVKPRLPGRARALVVDEQDPRRLWVGVEVGGIARSSDGGETWDVSLPGDNPDLHMMCAVPGSPEVLFASTGYGRFEGVAEMIEGNAGVFRSEDGGVSWEYAWAGVTPRYSRPMCIDQRSPFPLTVAAAPTAFSSFKDEGGAQAQLFRSDDGGRRWRSLCDAAHSPARENIHGLAPDASEPGSVVIGTDTGAVWRVSEASQWTLVADGLPAVFSVLDLA